MSVDDAIKPISMSLRDAGAYIGVCRRTLYNLINDGSIEMVKVRGKTLIRTASLDRLILEGKA